MSQFTTPTEAREKQETQAVVDLEQLVNANIHESMTQYKNECAFAIPRGVWDTLGERAITHLFEESGYTCNGHGPSWSHDFDTCLSDQDIDVFMSW